jgi:hypothetical protein
MGPLANYAILFLGQVIDGIAVLVHNAADKTPAPAPSNGGTVQIIGWLAGLVVTFIGGRLLHKSPPPPVLIPTPDIDDPNPATAEAGKAAGEAAAAASRATSAAAAKK